MTTFRIALLGDVMLGRGVNEVYQQGKPQQLWGDTLSVLAEADAVIANLECAITTHAQPWQRTPKLFHFGADPQAIDVLRAAGIGCVSLANNHILDFEEQGLRDTLKYLNKAGIAHAGAGLDLQAAMRPAMFSIDREASPPLSVGVIALTDNERSFSASADSPGTWYTPISTSDVITEPIRQQIAALREQRVGLIILSVHWGPNMVQQPPAQFQDFAHTVLDLGVDLIHGHSAHLFQGVSAVGNKLILYDTGDFLDDYAVDPLLRNDWSFIFIIELDDKGLVSLEMLPVRLHFARVELARGDEFESICTRMLELSATLGTDLEKTTRGLELVIRAKPGSNSNAT